MLNPKQSMKQTHRHNNSMQAWVEDRPYHLEGTFLNLNKMGASFSEAKWEHVLVNHNARTFLNTTMSACFINYTNTFIILCPP